MVKVLIKRTKPAEITTGSLDVKEQIRKYRYKSHRRVLFLLAMIITIAVLAIYSGTLETMKMTFNQVSTILYKAIMGIPYADRMEEVRANIIFDRSMPRTIAAILIGVSLAAGGAVMQSITRNPLTDSYTIGISSAAMLGATIDIVYGICIIPVLSGIGASIVNAFVFAMIPSIAIVFISTFKKMSSTMMILIGIGIMYMFNAFTTFIKFNADSESLQLIYEWGIGTLSQINGWNSTLPLIAGSALILLISMYLANSINVMSSGDNMALALGIKPIFVRILCFVAISASTGICVCFVGTIGFVGLVAPHIARLFVGSDNKILLPASAVLGALMVLVADILVRLLPGGLPVGVVTAVIGSPIFIYILYKQRKEAAF